MMVFAEQRATDGGTLLQRLDFKYDVFGNRIEKSVTTGSTTVQRSSWDGRNIWADLDGSSSLTTRRVFGDGVNEPLARIAGSAEWYLQDRMGSVRDVVNSAGTVIGHATYDAWGLVTGSSGTTDRYLAFGYQLDSESGLYYVMARYMDPVTHLFLQQDPIYADVNGYRYAGNNPTNATDPSGLEEIKYRDSTYAPRVQSEEESTLISDYWASRPPEQQALLNAFLNSKAVLPAFAPEAFSNDELVTEWQVEALVQRAKAWKKSKETNTPEPPPLTMWDALRFVAKDEVMYYKALINGTANAVVDVVTLGRLLGLKKLPVDWVWAATPEEWENGYWLAAIGGNLAGNIALGCGTGSVSGWAGRGLNTLFVAGNVSNTGQAAYDIYQNGFTVQNTLGLLTSAMGMIGPTWGAFNRWSKSPPRVPACPTTGTASPVRPPRSLALEKPAQPNIAKPPAAFAKPPVTALPPAKPTKMPFHVLNQVWCFVAGTPLLTPNGDKAIELLRPGDMVLARSEHNPEGAIEAKAVQQVFTAFAPVLDIHLRGQVVRVTGSHPFYVRGKGWICAEDLERGNVLVSEDGQEIIVERLHDSGESEQVYNVTVADYCTYFVGSREWGFSVWVHNQCTAAKVRTELEKTLGKLPQNADVDKILQRIADKIRSKADWSVIRHDIRELAKASGNNISIEKAAELAKAAVKAAVPKVYDIVPYGETASGFENHHGVLDVWAKENIAGYRSRASDNPSVRLTPGLHEKTKEVYRDWLRDRTGKPVGGQVDWKAVSKDEVKKLTKKMLDAASVPPDVQEAYMEVFRSYVGGKF